MMMSFKYLIWLIIFSHVFQYLQAQEKIVIEAQLPLESKNDSVSFQFSPIEYNTGNKGNDFRLIQLKPYDGKVKWVSYSDKPLTISSSLFGKFTPYIVEPGDSINISFTGGVPKFSGRGYEKFILFYEIKNMKKGLQKPINPIVFTVKSLNDFFEWNTYLDRQLEILMPIVDSFKNKVTSFIYNRCKASIIFDVEFNRFQKFFTLKAYGNKIGIDTTDLCNIFDSTFNNNKSKLRRAVVENFDIDYFVEISRHYDQIEIYRRFNFNVDHDSVNTKIKRAQILYNQAKTKYKGVIREKLLLYYVISYAINEVGFVPEVEEMLEDYYNQPGYPEFKILAKEFEYKERAHKLAKGKIAPNFYGRDTNGRQLTNADLKGKIAVVFFWDSNCLNCQKTMFDLRMVQNTFKNDSNIVFVTIRIGKDEKDWKQINAEQTKHKENWINLFSSDQELTKLTVRRFQLLLLPRIYVLDPMGMILNTILPDSNASNFGEKLTAVINQQIILMHDGPYVRDSLGVRTAFYILPQNQIIKRTGKSFPVHTDLIGKTFEVELKDTLLNEPSVYSKPSRLFVLSDIEGNFNALRKLLVFNKVIDEKFNWTFGKGHLICLGDFFDRGQQVTECLWLIYSLENKAKAAGGYVHFLLGNHEIMNLNGDHRYVKEKYKINASVLEKKYADLYSNNTELGRWLRTKNIIEKVGDVLFVHGGIGREISDLQVSITDLNMFARSYYDNENIAKQSSIYSVKALFSSKTSPFWYRRYYLNQNIKVALGANRTDTVYKTSMQELNNVLSRFNVNKIVTGHSIVADTVSCHYEGKVINIDTKHAEGKSEALFIEGNTFYRVNASGEKKQLLEPLKRPVDSIHLSEFRVRH